jgi:hypothetical protein
MTNDWQPTEMCLQGLFYKFTQDLTFCFFLTTKIIIRARLLLVRVVDIPPSHKHDQNPFYLQTFIARYSLVTSVARSLYSAFKETGHPESPKVKW